MTGRDIQEKITDTVYFVPKAMDFEDNGRLELENPASALEFLTLYLVLLSTAEFKEYDQNKLLENYQFIKSYLKEKGQICSNEFLSNHPENSYYVLRDNLCVTYEVNNKNPPD